MLGGQHSSGRQPSHSLRGSARVVALLGFSQRPKFVGRLLDCRRDGIGDPCLADSKHRRLARFPEGAVGSFFSPVASCLNTRAGSARETRISVAPPHPWVAESGGKHYLPATIKVTSGRVDRPGRAAYRRGICRRRLLQPPPDGGPFEPLPRAKRPSGSDYDAVASAGLTPVAPGNPALRL